MRNYNISHRQGLLQDLAFVLFLESNFLVSFSRTPLIINERFIFLVRDSVLEMKEIQPLYLTDKIAVIRGLVDGEIILNKPVPGAYEGMLVKKLNTDKP